MLLTHEHCDHMAGLEALRNRWPGVWWRLPPRAAPAWGHPAQHDPEDGGLSRLPGQAGVSYPPFVCRPADETYEHAWEYVWRGHRLRAVALPGHTPGSAGIFLDGDTFFSGDYLIPGRRSSSACPAGARRTTAPSRSPFSGAAPGLRICPGHGEPYILTGKE
ncbi:MAG: MBL fold metallo-hydrolase [Flavonifractor plautii]